MDFFPIFLDIKSKPCLVVGGGSVAARKVTQLLRAKAQVLVVAPTLTSELQALADKGEITIAQRGFEPGDLENRALAIAATDNESVNEEVSRLAQERYIPVNVVDNPDIGSFITPSTIERDPVQIAVSTGGASPVLARQLRAKLESSIPAGYGHLASLVEEYRDQVKARFDSVELRRNFWESVLEGRFYELVLGGKLKAAREELERALDEASHVTEPSGEVYLVGAGPGDPDLLTFRALRLMQRADVVVYDRLVSQPILDMVRRDAELIYAGKARADHAIPQEELNMLLARLAKKGKRVLRLKGGDPFIFGRGGEEIETLMAEGVAFQVVPGITAAAGCASYSGIPLTHRDYAQSVCFVTGHLKDGSIDLNWPMLAQPQQTVVFYMGLHGVKAICDSLIAHGRDVATPAALVEKGTTPEHKVHIGNLETLPGLVEQHDIKPPTLIIVGEVVDMHEKLSWFEPSVSSN
ncbi:MAG: uroporphyrinogen-III C-methyltransferase [Chromatiales bacterium]|nr:uroporphyrinogen-III C-methyltransferase [Chromatiales bacterium]